MTDTHVRDEEARQIRSESGFTLVELLIVIVILGILTAVVVFSVQGLRNSGNQAACKSQTRTVEIALESYLAKTGTYPSRGLINTNALPNQDTGLVAPAAANYTQVETQNILNHLTQDRLPGTPAPPGVAAATTQVRLLKSIPKASAQAATPALPSAGYEGAFVTLAYTPAGGGVTSAEMDVFGWYSEGGVVTACPE